MLPHSRTCKHAVLFYQDDGWLREQVSHHVMRALRAGQPAIVIARPDLLREVKVALHREHVHGAPFGPQRGSLLALDAEVLLADICVEGRPDPELFMRCVGEPVKQLARKGQVAAYGEMVSILCDRAQYAEAVELERLWNELLATCQATLHCGYHDRLFKTPESRVFYDLIRAAHDDVHEDPRLAAAGA